MIKFIKSNNLSNIAWLLALAIFFLVDRILKNIALKRKTEEVINLINNHLYFNFQANENIAFSIPLGNQIALIFSIIISFLLIIFIVHLYKKRTNKLILIPLLFLLFGSISNIIDRLLYSFVVDYLYIPWFTVFNIADAMISVSAIFLIIFVFIKDK
jgi:signal peptidase II